MKGQIMATKQKSEIQGQTVVCLKTRSSAWDGKEIAVAMEKLNAKCGHDHEWTSAPEKQVEPSSAEMLQRMKARIATLTTENDNLNKQNASLKTEIAKLNEKLKDIGAGSKQFAEETAKMKENLERAGK